MTEIDNDKLKLESILGTIVSRSAGVQVPIDDKLPIQFPLSTIHYELYKNHIELHIEGSQYNELARFLKENLPTTDITEPVERNFCKYAYILKRRIEGWKDICELGNAIIELRTIVEPYLLDYCENVSYELELAGKLGTYYEQLKELQPFHINVIDELHANENAHTRILVQLLKYQSGGKKPILKSFLELIPNLDLSKVNLSKANVLFNKDNIDCLIEKENNFAIIIENKIHWAVDQNKQIERYIKTEIEKGIPSDHIWVIYLTSDGRKHPEDYSLTQEAKDILADRYVEKNYRYDIIPWLKNVVLPNCKLKEEWLISAIKQYVDHLEGIFGLRDSQWQLQKKIQTKIENSIGCNEDMSPKEKYTRMQEYIQMLNELQNIAETQVVNIIEPIRKRFERNIIRFFEEVCPNEEISFYNGMHNGYFQVFLKKWPSNVHFEMVHFYNDNLLSSDKYTIVLHIEQKDLQADFTEALKSKENYSKVNIIGLQRYDQRTYYRKQLSTSRSMAEMNDSEMYAFIHDLFEDANVIESFVSSYLDK